MGLEVGTLALIGTAVAAGSAVISYTQQQSAQDKARKAADEQRKAAAVSSAAGAAQAAQEQRQQVREERIRRSQILNQAAATGTSGSSSEAGAVGALSTNLSSNIGTNRAAINSGQLITGFNQSAANYNTAAQNRMNRANMWEGIGAQGFNLFQSAGGFKTLNTMFG